MEEFSKFQQKKTWNKCLNAECYKSNLLKSGNFTFNYTFSHSRSVVCGLNGLQTAAELKLEKK